MKKNRLLLFLVLLVIVPGISLFAADGDLTNEQIKGAFDAIWLIVCGALVFFMQAGFTMVETGLTRAKNAGNIIMKNVMDFCVGALAFFAIGWGLMYGADHLGLIGGDKENFFFGATFGDVANSGLRDWFFQVVFAATAATIVSGAVAERTKFTGYLVYSILLSGLIYPITGHWIWGGGWLSGLGFHDFAGSTVVHSVGAWMALAGAIVLGPRIGKYVKAGGKTTSKAIRGHSLPLAALGVFILWFGWYGFNAGSTLSGTDTSMAAVVVTTTLAPAAAAVMAMLTSWITSKKPDVSMTLNGVLAGLVAITAGTAVVSNGEAILIGAIAGVLVVLAVEFIDKVLHIDDPVGAVSVHGICGLWGTVAVGFFGDLDAIAGITGHAPLTRIQQIGVQFLGAGAVFAFVFGLGLLIFFIIKKTIGLRVTKKEELQGLDIGEHGAEAYSGFQIFQNM